MRGYAVINNGEAALRSPCRLTPSLRAGGQGLGIPGGGDPSRRPAPKTVMCPSATSLQATAGHHRRITGAFGTDYFHRAGAVKADPVARVRRGMIQFAWRFLEFQKGSALAKWVSCPHRQWARFAQNAQMTRSRKGFKRQLLNLYLRTYSVTSQQHWARARSSRPAAW
jgi:hypothetical protein